MEGTVSQNIDIGPSFFSGNVEINVEKRQNSYPFFHIKLKLGPE